MIAKLLTEHHLVFLSLKGGYKDSSESTHVKMPHCWKSRHGSNKHAVLLNMQRSYLLHIVSLPPGQPGQNIT